jgi:glycosyltransferase involved in cell wall biosynthesis
MKYRKDVIFTGRLPYEILAEYLGSAYALTYISYFEGFGIPVLEAMYCDVPVITSDRTSLPEVAGDAGLIADPFNIGEIAHLMKNLAENKNLRQQLVERSKIHRSKFSWDITASKLWDSVIKMVNGVD